MAGRDAPRRGAPEPGGGGERGELRRLEAEPHVRLLLREVLVVVADVVDDEDVPPRPRQPAQGGERLHRAGRVVQHPRRHHQICADAHPRADRLRVELRAQELDVAIAARRDPRRRARELGLAAIDGEHGVEEGREQVQQGPIPAARVDGEAAPRERGGEREEVRRRRRRHRRRIGRRGVAGEELAPALVAAAHDRLHPPEAPVLADQAGSRGERVGHHRVGRGRTGHAEVHAGPLPALGEQPRLAQRGGVTAHVRLPLAEQLRQLANPELLHRREREQAQPHRLGEDPVELPAIGVGEGGLHAPVLCPYAHKRK